MTHQEFNFNFHNTSFYGQYWEAKQTEGVVVLVHGMGEHSSRYKHVAKKLTDNHFSVVTFDQFGHGKTKGKRGHNPNFEAVLNSVTTVIEKAKNLDSSNKVNKIAYGNILLKLNEHKKGLSSLAEGQGVIKFTQSDFKII